MTERLSTALIISLLCAGIVLPQDSRPAEPNAKPEEKTKEKTDAKPEEKPAAKKPARAPLILRTKRKAPERLALPRAGEHKAEDILTLAGVLSGRTVRLEGERVQSTTVIIDENLAGDMVNYQELKLILAAHKLYLFEVTDPEEGEILVASRNPNWKEEPPRFSRVIEIQGKDFLPAWERIKKAVDARNEKLPANEPPIIAVPDERTGKVLLGASKEEHLTDLAKELEQEVQVKDPNRPHLYTYTGRYRAIAELEKGLREKLAPADLNRLHIVQAMRGNRLYFRAPAEVWEKTEALLKELDVKKAR